MGKVAKGFIGLLVALLVLAAAGAAAAVWYIRPQQELTLAHEPIDLAAKGLEMVQSGKAELFLSGQDINNLARERLSAQPQVTPEFRIEGAQLTLQGQRLTADIAGRYRDLLDAGVQAEYRLEWRDPDLVATPLSAKLRGIALPAGTLEPIVIPVGSQLPSVVGIRSVEFRDGGVAVALQLRL
ncbi:hypothetical protein NYE40_21545 [Paenibacillus sp. FSL W8-1187]|uniref:Uncharacterized protein n=1 Tax=Paenibacillus pasadenensis TaxID=217090 RepID=A0A2N5NBX7_9BACL|nr:MULTISPECIES: hypothetical protein [Paenibacillus]PLT47846.1 hypothetical protein B8V81_0753 [Paenibacillus pasadenensis]QGG58010.1 hypothetical protein GE073_22175 [Paenibacillus sp. B01]